MSANGSQTVDPRGIAISNHARLRVMERFGVIERAADHVRELLADAEPVDVDYVTGAQAWEVGGVAIVTDPDGEVVQTVFEREVGDE